MKVELDIKKTVDQNASEYFEKAKKLKKKIEGIRKVIVEYEEKLRKEEAKDAKQKEASLQKKEANTRKKEWYEKFRWFVSSDGFLVIGGRDATTNDIIVKKHMEEHDLVFHTEAAGSPFVIIKNPENKTIPESTKQEAADFCASYSRGWKMGVSVAEVYSILPEQVSKEAKSGEYLSKGSFMIYGKRTYWKGKMSLGLCVYEGKLMAGPLSSVKKHAEQFVSVRQGNGKLSELGKKIQKKIGCTVDEIVRALPQGSELG